MREQRNWPVLLKRRRLAEDYWRSIPPERVDLDQVWSSRIWEQRIGPYQPCGAIGCLAGWLYSMPEIRESSRTWVGTIEVVSEWLDCSDDVFSSRRHPNQPQHEEAADRLHALVVEAEARVREQQP